MAHHQATFGLLDVPEHLCVICQGSDARRWYRRLHFTATYTSRERLLLIGGEDDNYHSIKQLDREYPGLQWSFILGRQRMDQTIANSKVSSSAVVIIWSGIHLPHSLSHLFKQAAKKQGIPYFSIEPGRRSISAICQGTLRAWGVCVDDIEY